MSNQLKLMLMLRPFIMQVAEVNVRSQAGQRVHEIQSQAQSQVRAIESQASDMVQRTQDEANRIVDQAQREIVVSQGKSNN